MPMVEKAAQRFENQMTLWETPVIKHLNQQMVGALNDEGIIQTQLAFRNLELTPAGLIVGAAMHAILRGIPFESGKWIRPTRCNGGPNCGFDKASSLGIRIVRW